MTRSRVIIAALACATIVLVALSALATAEVVARGKLVPSGGHGVRRVRIWDSIEFYVSSETARPSTDVLNTIVLSMLAAMVGLAALLLVLSHARGQLLWCLAIVSAGAAYLAADELLAIHESVGHNLQWLRSIPRVERPDDVVLAFYVVPIGLFAWYFRKILMAARPALILLVAAFFFAAVASVMDLADLGETEEWVELGTSSLVTVAFVVLMATSVPDAIVFARHESDGAAH